MINADFICLRARVCVCVRESVSDLYSRERAYDTDEKLAEESDRERERDDDSEKREQETRPNMGTGDAQRIPSFHSNRQVRDTRS